MPRTKWLTLLLVVATAVAGISQPCAAHRSPLPLALWGGFDSGAALCQRIIGKAAAHCGSAVWAARTTCLAAQVAGGACDQAATDAAVQQAHQDALDIVDRYCADYAVELGFTLTIETETDIDTFCQQFDAALMSGVYRPFPSGGTARQVAPDTGRCISATADAATHLLRVAFRSRTRALNRIASVTFGPAEKLRVVAQSTASIERARTLLQQVLQQRCPDPGFSALYGQSADALLALIAQRADCLGGAAYVQNAVLCPAAVCGNGMVEPTEQCDDGNTLVGDGCDGTCQREATPSP